MNTPSAPDPLAFDPDSFTMGSVEFAGAEVPYRFYEHVRFAAAPVPAARAQVEWGPIVLDDPLAYQSMNVYVPRAAYEGDGSAPILYLNGIGGYAAAQPGTLAGGFGGNDHLLRALARGWVVVLPGSRGRSTVGEDGAFTGKAPAAIVDLKAGVRYLRHNDPVFPGSAERIVSMGVSAGGATSALLGASGNDPAFDPYLEAIGAADARDDIFAVVSYCPITDLEHQDAAYEWLYSGVREAIGGDERPLRWSRELAALFPEYLNGLGLRDEAGRALTGTAMPGVLARWVTASAQRALDAGQRLPRLGEEFLVAPPAYGAAPAAEPVRIVNDWLTVEDGTVAGIDVAAFLRYVAATIPLKDVPAFDAYGIATLRHGPFAGSYPPENELFGDARSPHGNFTAWGLSTRLALSEAPADSAVISPALAERVRLMNPLHFLLERDATVAPHWYIRHGVRDRDGAFTVPISLHYALQRRGVEASTALSWDVGHAGYYDNPEAFAWIDGVLGK